MALASSFVALGTFVAVFALFSLGLNLKFGFNGLLDIGHVAFFLIGAFTAALLVLPPSTVPSQGYATYILGLRWTWPAAIAAATVVAGIAGMLVALPSIRLREDYLAISVLGISVIARRIIQTEGWLANGPTSLKGWSKPLAEMFPLPGGAQSFDVVLFGVHVLDLTLFSVPSAVLFGAIVTGVWALLLYGFASYLRERDGSTRQLAVHALVAVVTLGVGYVAVRRGRREDRRTRYAVSGAAVVGLLATGAGLLGSSIAVAVPGAGLLGIYRAGVGFFMGLASLQTWVLGGLAVVDHYRDFPRRDARIGVGVGLLVLVVFSPVVLLHGGWLLSVVEVVLTLVFLAGYVAGVYWLGERWREYGSGGSFVSVLGVAAVTLFAVRVFVLSLIEPLKDGGPAAAVDTTVANLLWLVRVQGSLALNYSRFRLLLVLFALAAVYYVVERTVRSPFGRALKAVRDDEDVASALGKNTFRFKVQSMILGSAIAGLAGALFAMWFGALAHTMFRPRLTFFALLIVVVGGTANNRGAILGAVVLYGFRRATSQLKGFFPPEVGARVAALRLVVIGAVFIAILYFRPEGIWPEQSTRMEEIDE